jgi:hypothetical protein
MAYSSIRRIQLHTVGYFQVTTTITVLSPEAFQAIKRDHDRLRYEVQNMRTKLHVFINELDDLSSGEQCVAILEDPLDPRDGTTPGGPATAQPQKIDDPESETPVFIEDGDTVEVWTWVDKAILAGDYVFIEKDKYGVWWTGDKTGEGGNNCVATTDTIIPKREGVTAGGPIGCITYRLEAGTLTAGETVQVFSWISSDSSDPEVEEDGILWIFIEQDAAGVWWFTGQDCPAGMSE